MHFQTPFLSFVFYLLTPIAQSAHAPDEIFNLPGFSGILPSKQYSGYLSANDGTSHLHYWFVESEMSPKDAPVVVWLNGGPGCSSLDGFFYEQGPFELSTSGDKLKLRDHRWNRIANMLFIEAPVGVGFSYSDVLNYNNSDDRTAIENREAVEYFFTLFPEYKSNEFYLSGESYAGIYVPTLAEAILKGEDDGTYTGPSLKGIAVGNGCTGNEIGICGWYFGGGCQGLYYAYKFLLEFAFFENSLKEAISNSCDWAACASATANLYGNKTILSDQCLDLLDKSSMLLGDINIYNVFGECSFLDSCPGPKGNAVMGRLGALGPSDSSGAMGKSKMHQLAYKFKALGNKLASLNGNPSVVSSSSLSSSRTLELIYDDDYNPLLADSRGPAGCIDSAAATSYLMRADVQKAIHVKEPGYCWAVCNQAPGFTYNSTRPNLPRDTYPYLISRIKVLIYNGDWDACVPYTDNQGWTENMGFSPLRPWHPWTYTAVDNSSQIGGYSVKYNISSLAASKGASFEFRTIRGAGHMVPTDAPQQGMALISYFLGRSDHDIYYQVNAESTPACASDDSIVVHKHGFLSRAGMVALMFVAFVFVVGTYVYLLTEIQRLRKQVEMVQRTASSAGTGLEMTEHGKGYIISEESRNPVTPYTTVRTQEDGGRSTI